MITEIDDYFAKGCGRCARFDTPECSARLWAQGLTTLREICRSEGLDETLKWAHPCYMYAGRNIAIIGALRGDFRMSFFNAALMQDPECVLERQGPNTTHKDMFRFRSHEEVARCEPVIRDYLREAMAYAKRGLLPPKDEGELDLPQELVEALGADPELAAAFQALTPGRRKSYVLNLRSAKQSQTRATRIGRFRQKIIAGKGATER